MWGSMHATARQCVAYALLTLPSCPVALTGPTGRRSSAAEYQKSKTALNKAWSGALSNDLLLQQSGAHKWLQVQACTSRPALGFRRLDMPMQ